MGTTPTSGLRSWLSEASGADEVEGLDSQWADFASNTQPVVTLFGAYDTGKSSIIRRLLVDSGKPIPEWLTVSARPWSPLRCSPRPGHPKGYTAPGGSASSGTRLTSQPGGAPTRRGVELRLPDPRRAPLAKMYPIHTGLSAGSRLKSAFVPDENENMSRGVSIPTALVVSPQMLPRCCVRHGEPVVKWTKVSFSSRSPLWVYATLILGILPTLIILLALRRQVHAPAWPFCGRCIRLRRIRMACAFGGAVLWYISCGLISALVGDQGLISNLCIVGLAVGTPLVACVVGSTSRWVSIANGFVSQDGGSVKFPSLPSNFTSVLDVHYRVPTH